MINEFIFCSLLLWQIGIISYILLNKFYGKNPKKIIQRDQPTAVEVDLPKKKSAKIYYQYKIEDLDKKNSEVLNIIGLSLSLN